MRNLVAIEGVLVLDLDSISWKRVCPDHESQVLQSCACGDPITVAEMIEVFIEKGKTGYAALFGYFEVIQKTGEFVVVSVDYVEYSEDVNNIEGVDGINTEGDPECTTNSDCNSILLPIDAWPRICKDGVCEYGEIE